MLARQHITHALITPAALATVPADAAHGLPDFRTVIVGGEACPAALADRWATGRRLINSYGPTESTVVATWSDPLTPGHTIIPIGQPIWNTQVYVLDRGLRPVPPGIAGELFIGGAGLARGYLEPGGADRAAVYRAPVRGAGRADVRDRGTWPCWTGTGQLEYLGRADEQVKIRGFRIEPGEIETALTAHPAIADAAVIAREDTPGRKHLDAYLIPAPGTTAPASVPPAGDLRAYLAATLPDYMIPAAFVTLDVLPLTPGGKLDRRALPAPDRDSATAGHVPPRTPAEQAIAAIWADVLGLDQVGVHDNFFELGGDSILSIQIVSRARRAGHQFTARDLFLHQTIAELAPRAIPAATGPAVHQPLPGPAPLTPIQHWFFARFASGEQLPGFTMSVLLQTPDDLDEQALSTAIDAVVTHHDALRLRFSRRDGQWRQEPVPCPAGLLRHCDLTAAGDTAQPAAMAAAAGQARAGLDPGSGQVIAPVLFTRGSGGPPLLFIAVHHLVTDVVSWQILLADLEKAYQDIRAGRPPQLEPAGTPFTRWAHELTEQVRRGGFDQDLAYWTQTAGSVPAELPADRPAATAAGPVRTVSVRLSPEQTDALLHQVPAAYRTQINDVLLTALGQTLTEWTGRDSALIALEGHGREDVIADADLYRTLGWFTTEFPVALHLPPGQDWGQALKSVKEQLRAIPRRGLSYAALRYLSDDGTPAAALRDDPAPQISFNYSSQWDVPPEHGTALHPLREGTGQDLAPVTRPLTVTGLVTGGALELNWLYCADVYDTATIRQLAERMVAALGQIVDHCARPGTGGRTPSDFPLVTLDQAATDRLAGDGSTVEDIWPLTPLQAGMLFHSMLDAGSAPYLNQARMLLDGVTDPRALGQAWQQVTDRTPILRGAVIWQDVNEPVLVIHRQATIPITYHDWRSLPGPQRGTALQQILDTQDTDVDLTHPPLLRLAIAQLPAGQALLIWTSHHIILDGWSLGQVIAEVFSQYAAITTAREPSLPERRPFRDYLHWLQHQDSRQAEQHWRQILAGFDTPTPLPYDRPPAQAHRTESSRRIPVTLPDGISQQLHTTARRNGLTLNTIIQGAWGLLLARYSNTREAVFGATVSGRPPELPGVESIIGMFINTIPTRVRTPRGQDTLTWLRDLQTRQSQSRQYDFASLPQLQSWSDLPPGTNLFSTMIVFENYPYDQNSATQAGLHIHDIQARDTTNFPLTLIAYLTDQLHINLTYDPHLFDTTTATTIARRLQHLLTTIATNPTQPVDTIQLTTPTERAQVLAAGAGPVREVPASARSPGTVPGPGATDAGRDRAGGRADTAQLRRAQHPGQPAGPPPGRRRGGPGTPHRASPAPDR